MFRPCEFPKISLFCQFIKFDNLWGNIAHISVCVCLCVFVCVCVFETKRDSKKSKQMGQR